MQGFNALWMPGTDHAGIATQAVVERRLLEEEKKTPARSGPRKLVERIWAWKKRIRSPHSRPAQADGLQLRLAADALHARRRLCPGRARTRSSRFFADGLIYRGKRLVNWDTFLQTAVSDDEVFHETVAGHFWHFRYPVIDPQPGEPTHRDDRHHAARNDAGRHGRGGASRSGRGAGRGRSRAAQQAGRGRAKSSRPKSRRSSTTWPSAAARCCRSSSKLRDMARAGRKLRLPLLNREIPLVADEWAKPELGSGCVKITPAHDPNDYEVGQRQQLPMINILNPDGTLNANAGPYQGLKIAKARERVVADLEALGLVGRDRRSRNRAGPFRPLEDADRALSGRSVVRADGGPGPIGHGRRERRPREDHSRRAMPTAISIGWARKRDWPVSRQLWWGHQIPIWYAPDCQRSRSEAGLRRARRRRLASRRRARRLADLRAGRRPRRATPFPGHTIAQDPDVLDTWFSSALWPHSTLGLARARRPSWRTTIRPARWSPAATSSRCGSPGWC